LDFLEQFDIDVQYRRGLNHGNADSLSRRPCETQRPCGQCCSRRGVGRGPDEVVARVVTTRRQARDRAEEVTEATPTSGIGSNRLEPIAEPRPADIAKDRLAPVLTELKEQWSPEWLVERQKEDTNIGKLYDWFTTRETRPSRDDVMHVSPEVKSYISQWDSLTLINGVIYRKFERPEGGVLFFQLITPKSLRVELLQLVHAGAAGHMAFKRTAEHVQRRAYWTTWRTDTERFCKACEPCNQYHRGKVPKQGLLKEMRVGAPMERIQVDLTGPHLPSAGFTYICTCICAFTKYVVAWPIRDKKATTVAKGLVERVILPLGTPYSILTDNGKEFDNELCQEIWRILGVDKRHTTPYYPACNGQIERFHRTMNALLGKTIEVHQKDWPQRLPYVVNAYNGCVQEATGFTPNFLMFGRELNVAVDIVLGNPSGPPKSVNDYAEHLTGLMASAYEEVREHLGKSARRAKHYYDFSAKPQVFVPGDLVWVFSPRQYQGRSPKWSRCYSGPWEVVRRVNAVNYAVRRSPRSAAKMIHVNKLKPYLQPGLEEGGAKR